MIALHVGPYLSRTSLKILFPIVLIKSNISVTIKGWWQIDLINVSIIDNLSRVAYKPIS